MKVNCRCCFLFCGLKWESCRDFTRTQWHIPKWLFLIYRLIAAFYTCGFQIYSWSVNFRPNFYAFVTNWTYLVLTLYVVFAAGNLIVDLVAEARHSAIIETPTLAVRYSIQWVLYDIIVTWSIIVAIVYWGLLFEQHSDVIELFENISDHLLPAVFGLMEVVFTATPCLGSHVVYPTCYAILYLTFTVLFWATGNNPPYYFLDYGGDPVYPVVSILCLAAANFIIYALIWALTKLRQWIAGKTNECRCGDQPDGEVDENLPKLHRVTTSEGAEGSTTHII